MYNYVNIADIKAVRCIILSPWHSYRKRACNYFWKALGMTGMSQPLPYLGYKPRMLPNLPSCSVSCAWSHPAGLTVPHHPRYSSRTSAWFFNVLEMVLQSPALTQSRRDNVMVHSVLLWKELQMPESGVENLHFSKWTRASKHRQYSPTNFILQLILPYEFVIGICVFQGCPFLVFNFEHHNPKIPIVYVVVVVGWLFSCFSLVCFCL